MPLIFFRPWPKWNPPAGETQDANAKYQKPEIVSTCHIVGSGVKKFFLGAEGTILKKREEKKKEEKKDSGIKKCK